MSNHIKESQPAAYNNDDYTRFAATDYKNHQEIHDMNVGEEACAVLMKNSLVDATNIILAVHDDEVTLSGFVSSKREKSEAEHCLRALPEVTAVINQLQIRR